jgi:predicted GTPase
MNVEVQSYLMQEIKKIQQTMENYVEIRDILTTVEKLEEENEALKERLKSATEANQQLTEVVL